MRHAAPMDHANKSERLNLRVSPKLRRLFQVAADLEDQNLSAFILEAARVRAEQRLADQDRFALPPSRLRAFMHALEAPPRDVPGLRALMQEPSVLERDRDGARTDSLERDDPTSELR